MRSDDPQSGTQQEVVVEFTQQITVQPPEEIDDPEYAADWFWNLYSEIGWDAIDPAKKENYEVTEIRPVQADIDHEEN